MIVTVLLTTGILIVFLSLAGIFILRRSGGEIQKQKVALQSLATIWQKKQSAILSLEELARLWRDDMKIKEEIEKDISFNNKKINDFYKNRLEGKAFFIGNTRKVITELLRMLDAEGDCPSVVSNVESEVEGKMDRQAYDILAKVTLTEHTINVAEEMIKLFPSAALASKTIITALGHDIGKIPSFRKKLYSMGDHPLMAITILEGIKEFKELNFKDEVLKAIRDHHRRSKGFLVEKLKEADQSARRMEMSLKACIDKEDENIQPIVAANEPEPAAADNISTKELQEEKSNPASKKMNCSRKEATSEVFFGKENSTKEVNVKEVPVDWLESPSEIIENLRPYINKLYGPRWEVFSMPDGVVYVQVKTMWEVIKKTAKQKGHLGILAGDTDEDLRRNLIFSVVQILRVEADAIARGLIQDNYFSAPFTVRMRDGTEYNKAVYIPFNVEAFSASLSELEEQKSGRLKDIAEVLPRYDNNEPEGVF